MSPQQAQAQQAAEQAGSFVATFNEVILFPTIALLTAVAFLVFIWGCVEYFINSTNEQGRQQGVKHITFGIIGLVIMISAFAILNIAANTFDLSDELRCANDPTDRGCDSVFQIPGGPVGGGAPGGGMEGGGAPGGGMEGGGAPGGGM